MSCNCSKAINTGSCIGSFTVGQAEIGLAYNVYFKIPNGRVAVYPVTSSYSDGTLIVEAPKVRIGDIYQIWINKPGDPQEKMEMFTINDTEVTCVNIEFTECFEEDEFIAPVDQALTLEE